MSNAIFRLDSKVAIVTGGSSGIGKSCAGLLARQGASVYVLDVDDQNGQQVALGLKSDGLKCTFLKCDMTSGTEVSQCVSQVFEQEGRIDILINNAGISHIGNIEQTSEADMDRVYDVNVKGAFHALQSVIPYMKQHQDGRIVNIASVAVAVGLSDRFAYSMSKAAVASMSLTVAKDYLKANIRSNSISPGRVHTPFVDKFLEDNYPGREEEMYKGLAATQPVGRMGTPDEIAYLALYLCSDEAAFITGSNFAIDGGLVTLNT